MSARDFSARVIGNPVQPAHKAIGACVNDSLIWVHRALLDCGVEITVALVGTRLLPEATAWGVARRGESMAMSVHEANSGAYIVS